MTTQEINEMNLEFSEMTTKELKSYKNGTKFMSIIFNKTTVFLVLFAVIFSVALPTFLSTGSCLIFIVATAVHFICFRLVLKWMPNLEKDGKECRMVNKMIKEELSNRK